MLLPQMTLQEYDQAQHQERIRLNIRDNKLLQEAKSNNDINEYLRLSVEILNENRDEKFYKVLKIYDYWEKQQLLIEKDTMRLNKEVRSGNQNYQPLFKSIEQLRNECWKMLANNDLIDKIIVDDTHHLEQDKEIIVEKVELTTVSDEYGHKTYKHTEVF